MQKKQQTIKLDNITGVLNLKILDALKKWYLKSFRT